ncbi:MAG: hypothetical protein IPG76_03065 [Acidobacteria bacterium]|nr:hypothetical protein [Acidobacteriota bacterium]
MELSDLPVASRLLRAIGLKTLIEIVLLCVIAAAAAFTNFSPLLRGAIDIADRRQVAGWVSDPLSGNEKIEVQLYLDGGFAASVKADRNRTDLVKAGATEQPDHGFKFDLGGLGLSKGVHTAQVFAVRPASNGHFSLIPVSKMKHEFIVD